ncbi:hypothetical protein KSP40_PGU004195 [Platanthera guangdongensis]|uniref:ATPase AAA-type core domain-containing protein n=1 Tax=Platanthera guangdongensis TaxID=2320717 RepID=A0ABR2N1H2_9ASPA
MLNFMDDVFSCCSEERVMVFTASNKNTLDPTVIRPGRRDVQIHFPLCDFTTFKTLASNYLERSGSRKEDALAVEVFGAGVDAGGRAVSPL